MDNLTSKQSALLVYIYHYRYKYGHTPSLKEMVTQLDVSDNKSLLRIIDALIEKGYLSRKTKKTNTVTLSDKGYQLVSGFPFRYEKLPDELSKTELPTELGRSGASVSLSTSNTLGYQESKLDVNGTSGRVDIDTIIETAVNLAISKYFSGTKLDSNMDMGKSRYISNFIQETIKAMDFSENFRWGLTLVVLTWAFNLITRDTFTAFFYSIFGSILISYLTKKL